MGITIYGSIIGQITELSSSKTFKILSLYLKGILYVCMDELTKMFEEIFLGSSNLGRKTQQTGNIKSC